jgi:hypothetical protein
MASPLHSWLITFRGIIVVYCETRIIRSADKKQELLIVKDKAVPPHATKALGGEDV